nr:protein-tyrosine-phosphatase ptp1 [Quercus suber]
MGANRITPSEIRRSCIVALDRVNLSKNRYSDVIPFDKNRVVLNSCKDYKPAARGYINASLITTSSSENISQFIATQGPLPQTYEDFWVMVMHYRCPVVVMLTSVDNSNLASSSLSELRNWAAETSKTIDDISGIIDGHDDEDWLGLSHGHDEDFLGDWVSRISGKIWWSVIFFWVARPKWAWA